MDKTDRQTDIRTLRGSWWGPCTSYNEEHWLMLEKGPYPPWIKAIYGGYEVGEECGRKHYQFAVHTTQIRASMLMDWIPRDHIQLARDKTAVQKYCMKTETAVGDKKVIENDRKYMEMHESLLLVAKNLDGFKMNPDGKCWEADEYWFAVRKIITDEPFRISQFSVPIMEKAWVRTRSVWMMQARALVLQPSLPSVPSRFCPVCNERMSNCGCSSDEESPDSEFSLELADR